jgi:hypothetical protein
MASDDDKRKSPRIQLKLTFSVAYGDTLVAGELVDLSTGGICFKSKFEFPIDSSLFMTLPGCDENEVEAKVLRCDQYPFSGYKVAANFIGGELSQLEGLAKFIKGDWKQ